jgi:predicted permease
MSCQPLGLRVTRLISRLLLRSYPAAFSRRFGRSFVDAAADRWKRERMARSETAATLRVGLLLFADTMRAAPNAWRSGVWRTPAGSGDPRVTPRARLMYWISGASADLRLAFRMMRRQPASYALVVATMALGIGVCTAAFGALDRVVLNALPFENGDRMRYLALQHRTLGWRITPSAEIVERWRQGARTLERIESYRDVTVIRVSGAPAERLRMTQISIGLAGMLGVRPRLGRMLVEADAATDAPAAVMVHETFWRREFGADAGVVGRALNLTTGPATVVGVWPSDARLDNSVTPELIRIVPRDREIERGSWTAVLAVMRPGANDADVSAELGGLIPSAGERSANFKPAVVSPVGFVGDAYVRGLWLVFAAAVILFGVSLVNAGNLLLARASTRQGEVGVRLALGGSRTRIMRLFAAESLILTLAGIAAGLGVARLTAEVYAAWEPLGLVADTAAWLGRRTLTFAASAAVMMLLVGIVMPVWRARTASVRGAVASTGSPRSIDGSSRLRAVLIGAQAAMAVLLVAGAALTGRSFDRLASVDPGFDVDALAMVSVSPPPSRYTAAEAREAFVRRVREAIEALPQVERVTITAAPPFATTTGGGVPVFEGEPEPAERVVGEVATQTIDRDYFAVFGIPVVAGRIFESSDDRNAMIINESFARAHGGNVLGRRLRFGSVNDAWFTIVGVVRDVSSNALSDDPARRPQLYLPSRGQSSAGWTRFVMRVNGDPASVIKEIRAKVTEIDRAVPLAEASTVRQLFEKQTGRHRFVALLLGGFALFGIVFAASGVYGVVSLDVARRRREVGVRVALGATASQVIRQVIMRGLRPVVGGSVLGVAAALWLGPFLEDLLFRIPARDPWSTAAGVGFVLATAALACALPACRAARIDPAITLKVE